MHIRSLQGRKGAKSEINTELRRHILFPDKSDVGKCVYMFKYI